MNNCTSWKRCRVSQPHEKPGVDLISSVSPCQNQTICHFCSVNSKLYSQLVHWVHWVGMLTFDPGFAERAKEIRWQHRFFFFLRLTCQRWIHRPVFQNTARLGGGFKYFLFSSIFGEMIPFNSYFSNGLKPPTSMQYHSPKVFGLLPSVWCPFLGMFTCDSHRPKLAR